MELVPLGPGFGVEVRGVSILDVATDAEAYKAVRAAFEEHSLLVFHDQPIADDIQVAYSRAFGPLELTKVASVGAGSFYSRLTNLNEKGEIVPPDHRQVLVAQANALWHTDSSFKQTPALASVLTARVLPGGIVIATAGANPPHQEALALVARDFDGKELWRFDHNLQIDTQAQKGVWSARVLEMSDIKGGSRTMLKLEKLEYNVTLSADGFTLQALRQ